MIQDFHHFLPPDHPLHPPKRRRWPDEDEQDESPIGLDETRALRSVRALVATFLVLCALTVALAVYYFLDSSQQEELAQHFHHYADSMEQSVQQNLMQTLQPIDGGPVISMLSYNNHQESSFMNIPHFAVQAAKWMSFTHAAAVQWSPLIRTPEERIEWENYTARYSDTWVSMIVLHESCLC